MLQNIPLFDKRRGEQITASYCNGIILKAYQKFNRLIPDNVKTVTTGQFLGKNAINNLTYPNYCGIMSSADTVMNNVPGEYNRALLDMVCIKASKEAEDVLKLIGEVS